jgi:hypothetical protein
LHNWRDVLKARDLLEWVLDQFTEDIERHEAAQVLAELCDRIVMTRLEVFHDRAIDDVIDGNVPQLRDPGSSTLGVHIDGVPGFMTTNDPQSLLRVFENELGVPVVSLAIGSSRRDVHSAKMLYWIHQGEDQWISTHTTSYVLIVIPGSQFQEHRGQLLLGLLH